MIPTKKGFHYFHVEWEANGRDGGSDGFAQMIETTSFPKDFALDTVAGEFVRRARFDGTEPFVYAFFLLRLRTDKHPCSVSWGCNTSFRVSRVYALLTALFLVHPPQ